MNLANGQTYLAIPGPSVIPEAVLRAMHRASPNIYEGELVDLTHTLVPDLRYVAQTNGHVALYIANGHGAWEAALANMACHGDRVLVVATGWFAHGWAKMARAMGIHADIVECVTQSPIDLDALETALRAHPGDYYKAVLVTHVDTSTSVKNEIAPVRKLLDDLGSDALLGVDCVASLGCDEFKMDAWGVDVMVAACQKGLMVPAGMAFVYFNDTGTAPTHHLYGLRVALDMIRAEGIENIWARHEKLANAIWAAIDCWGNGGPMRMNIQDRALRSTAVTALHLGMPHAKNLRTWTQHNAGLTLGIGLGMSTNDIPHGSGAIDAAATIIAGA